MNPITTISQLIESFDKAQPSEQAGILKKIEIPVAAFEKYATWKKGEYTRNCIGRTQDFEMILLCWDTGTITPMHDHANQNCWVYQVQGKIREKRYKSAGDTFLLTNDMLLTKGRISYMHDRMGYHTIENPTDRRAMTLHVYVNPIDRCKVYNKRTSSFELKEMQYDTIHDAVIQQEESS